jgi:hypothetical protein
MAINHKNMKAPRRPYLPHEHTAAQMAPIVNPARGGVQLQNSSRLPLPHERQALSSGLTSIRSQGTIPKITQRPPLPHERTPLKGALTNVGTKAGPTLQPLMRQTSPPATQRRFPLPPSFNSRLPKLVMANTLLPPSHTRAFRPLTNSIQPYAEAVLDEKATMVNPATKARLASGKKTSLRNYGAVCYRMAGGAWTTLTGVSQQWEELSNPTTHAERAVIAKLCSAAGFACAPEAPKSIGERLRARNVQIQWLFTELQPCAECEAWLREIDNSVTINVQYSWMLEDSRDMSQQERTRAQKHYINQYFGHTYNLDEGGEEDF